MANPIGPDNESKPPCPIPDPESTTLQPPPICPEAAPVKPLSNKLVLNPVIVIMPEPTATAKFSISVPSVPIPICEVVNAT